MLKDESPNLSGVAAVVYPLEGDAHILLTKRQSYKGVHSGQVSFPGGKLEEEDPSLEYTARREMEEEVGIENSEPRLVRSLTKLYIPPSRHLVHPFLFTIEKLPDLSLDPREVNSVIHLPLKVLLDKSVVQSGMISVREGYNMKTNYIEFKGHKIWGATAMMLSEIKELIQWN